MRFYHSLKEVPFDFINPHKPVILVGDGESGSAAQYNRDDYNLICINHAHTRQRGPAIVTLWWHTQEILDSLQCYSQADVFPSAFINIAMDDVRVYGLRSGNTLNMFLQYIVQRWEKIDVYLAGVDHTVDRAGKKRDWKLEIEGISYCNWIAGKKGSGIFNTSINKNLGFLELRMPPILN